MKFKKITNKLNNFVVQKLKKIKNNDANNTSAMPAMPKEKSSILAENHYTELKMKDNLMLGGSGARKDANPNETAAPTTASQQQQQQNDSNKSASIANHTTNASAKNAHKSVKSTTTSSTSATTTQQNGGSPQAQAIVPDPTKIRTAHDFRFGKSIGEGSFSTVYLAKDIHTRKEYAIKVCEKQQILRERKQEYIKSEREVMHLLNNVPGFVNLYCTFQDYKSLYFVMTFAKHGDMLPHLNKVGSFDLACSQFYAAELVLSLENMHRRGIVHRDLKPENILFDEKMHTLIADFGSSKILSTSANATTTATTTTTATPTNNHTTSATAANASTASAASAADDADFQAHRKRKSSFVGTAQYVSPEMLNGQSTAKASDLWALGCIIYQMISGLPPFRAVTEYLIFQKILKLDLVFPEGFDTTAADLVAKLLQLDPLDRLGATDAAGCYSSIRAHPFFAGIEWQGLRSRQPPPIHPYLPGVESSDEEDGVVVETYRVPDHLETGLDERQLRRMLGVELGTAMPATAEEEEDEEEDEEEEADERDSEKIDAKQPKNILNIPAYERRQRIDAQRTDNKWHQFVDDEVILKQGFVNKRKGLFARKRMLLLTTGPRLVYVDPVQMVKKGEIPWSRDVRVEPKNFKIFFVHTPNRTYYLEDPQGFALEWCQIIEDVRANAFSDDAPSTQQSAPSTTTTTKSSSATGTKKTSQRASGAASS